MQDYRILSGKNADELNKKVIEYLKKGYQLAGGHQVTTMGYSNNTNASNALRAISPERWEITQSVYINEVIKEKTVI